MSAVQASLKYDNSTDARFKNWGNGISSKLTTGGFWTKASDSGQVDWTSNPAHPVAGDRVYYEVWKSADALSSTCPIYMKIIYGGSGTSNAPVVKLQFSTGSDGAGGLTGNQTTAADLYNPTASLSEVDVTHECDFAGGVGYFTCLLWRDAVSGNVPQGFVIERAIDSSGGYRDAYFTVVMLGTGVSNAGLVVFKPAGGTSKADQYATTIYFTGSTGAYGSNTAVFPIFPMVGLPDNPLSTLVTVKAADQVEGSTFQMTVYGVTRTYLHSQRASFSGFTPCSVFPCWRFD